MANQFKNVMIGIFVIAAFAIIIFILLFLHPNIGNEGKTLRVRFADIDKITPGTRVTFAGKPVGEVLSINEIGAGERIDHNGLIYVYELLLAVDTSVNVYTGDEITARTSGLLGEKSVSILPNPPEKNQPQILVTDQIIYANETGSVDAAIKSFKALSDKVEIFLDNVNEALGILREKNTWENLADGISSFKDLAAGFNESKVWEPLNDAVRKIDTMTTTLADANSAERLTKTIANLEETSNSTKSIAAHVERGEGSLGKLFMRDDFNLSLASLMSKAEITLNDVNHYGILFHQDKGWQRLRARRLNLLQKLRTPQEFRNYFNDEIDSIATSLERVSKLIEDVDALPCSENLWENPCYAKVYAELLRRVATLEEYLQMYNQQVMGDKTNNCE